MTKRKRSIIILSLLIFATGLAFFRWSKGADFPVIQTGLSQEAVSELIGAAKAERQDELFRSLSWRNLKKLPGALHDYYALKIYEVALVESDYYYVGVQDKGRDPKTIWRYVFHRESNQWRFIGKGLVSSSSEQAKTAQQLSVSKVSYFDGAKPGAMVVVKIQE